MLAAPEKSSASTAGDVMPFAEWSRDMNQGTILIVDDNQTLRDTLRRYLAGIGYDVLVCSDGPSALGMVATATFDIVLADYEMPEMDGAELVRRMREQHVRAYLIGFSVEDKERLFMEAGADKFIRKDQLTAALATTIRKGVAKK